MNQTAGSTPPKTGHASPEGSSETPRRRGAERDAREAGDAGHRVKEAAGSRPPLNCPSCGEPVPLSVWDFNPLNNMIRCRSCSSPSRVPSHARLWGITALFSVMVVELLLIKDFGLFEPRGLSAMAGQAALYLFVVFSSLLSGSLVCRKLSAALVP